MTRRFYTRSVVKGEITLPAVPSMIDEYVTMCAGLFAGVGRKFSDEELAHLRAVLQGQLAEAYAASQRSTIVISYNGPHGPDLALPSPSPMADGGAGIRELDRHP